MHVTPFKFYIGDKLKGSQTSTRSVAESPDMTSTANKSQLIHHETLKKKWKSLIPLHPTGQSNHLTRNHKQCFNKKMSR